jgi:hypothetical protein
MQNNSLEWDCVDRNHPAQYDIQKWSLVKAVDTNERSVSMKCENKWRKIHIMPVPTKHASLWTASYWMLKQETRVNTTKF